MARNKGDEQAEHRMKRGPSQREHNGSHRHQTNPATDLMGDESLDADEVGIGLDGAENMGQDGERGEAGLGFGGLQDITTRKLVSTQGNHNRSTGGSRKAR